MKLKTIFTRMKSMLENFLACMSYKQKVALSLLCGIIVGLTGLFGSVEKRWGNFLN